ncbi:unnamed protein product [Durusdinium trenchii]|uniref:Aurora kinase n=1 Tax=Durusdinium trenchii TaxID=1381693 RepID=A0ABP0I0Y8_9DINO
MATPSAKEVEDLQFEKCLGRGYFGEVWRAQLKKDRQLVAVKKVRMQLILENHLMDQLKREILILSSMQHERIVRLFFHFEDRHFMYLGMEFCQGGSLFDKLQKAERFDAPVAARYFYETCEALDYLHHLPEKVIHRDIKPENILLTADDSVKLADFGWANLLEAEKRVTFCGTLDYLAPEMIKGTGHDESVDMWTMGVLLYELLTGQSPFGSSSKETTCKSILTVNLYFPPELDIDGRNLISQLCRKAPVDRLKVRDAMAHSFITRHLQTEQGDAAGYPEAKGAVVKGVTETGDMSPSRPSVVARKLRAECERSLVEKEIYMKALKDAENKLKIKQEELKSAEAQINEVQQESKLLEAQRKDLEKRTKENASKIEATENAFPRENA